jgi:hypothetical protein
MSRIAQQQLLPVRHARSQDGAPGPLDSVRPRRLHQRRLQWRPQEEQPKAGSPGVAPARAALGGDAGPEQEDRPRHGAAVRHRAGLPAAVRVPQALRHAPPAPDDPVRRRRRRAADVRLDRRVQQDDRVLHEPVERGTRGPRRHEGGPARGGVCVHERRADGAAARGQRRASRARCAGDGGGGARRPEGGARGVGFRAGEEAAFDVHGHVRMSPWRDEH